MVSFKFPIKIVQFEFKNWEKLKEEHNTVYFLEVWASELFPKEWFSS